MTTVGTLEIGGTHVTAALVDIDTWEVTGSIRRRPLNAADSANNLLTSVAATALDAGIKRASTVGVAIPDPFNYATGVARYRGVGKFDSLRGTNVGHGLADRLELDSSRIAFCNDADAFALGSWLTEPVERLVGITLGTGVGTGWVEAGRIADPGNPPGGRAHRLRIDKEPLEDRMSRRAIRRAYSSTTGDVTADVLDIVKLARAKDRLATSVLSDALGSLGRALGQPLRDFDPQLIFIGGSIAQSWDLCAPWFLDAAGPLPPVRRTIDKAAGLRGAACYAVQSGGYQGSSTKIIVTR